MADEQAIFSPIEFVYEYAGHGWALASISNGAETYAMNPSYVPTNPLFQLLHALVEVLRYGGDVGCEWFYEPAADRWALHRDGDRLKIVIRGVRDGFSHPNWPFEAGTLKFTTTCDLWKFAAKVRLAVSRLTPAGEKYHEPAAAQNTAEYRVLCDLLEEHKRVQPSTSVRRKRRQPGLLVYAFETICVASWRALASGATR